MGKQIGHIGIAVGDLKAAAEIFETLLGERPSGIEEITGRHVRAAFFTVGESKLELLEGTSPESAISKYVEKRGAGIHHICLRVANIAAEMERLKKAGFHFIDEIPRPGAEGAQIAFIHPSSTAGILIELQQPADE
jgi:methylmalonyl-CoA/ethylmalonyl-CoA epimerase